MAPQLSQQPAPCWPLAHLSDDVPGGQTQLIFLLRVVFSQDQDLCGRRTGWGRNSEKLGRRQTFPGGRAPRRVQVSV